MRAIAHIIYSHWRSTGMARRPLTNPRKQASQERSRATVDALVEATARILVREGFDKASTNRIAEAAGVSIGSPHPYHTRDLMQIVRAALAEIADLPLAEAVRRIVAAALDAHRLDPRLHRVLAEQIPRTGRLATIEAFNRESFAVFRGYLEQHKAKLRAVDLELAAFVCVTSIEALTHTAVLHHMLTDDRVATLVDEATRLVMRYLR